jgi:glycosyltransferase involved in cell wall biosynthesis
VFHVVFYGHGNQVFHPIGDALMPDIRVLITASTLPRWPGDAVPSFVLDQAVALIHSSPVTAVEILAPHDAGAARDEIMQGIPVHRFRYFWPASLQRLAYPAILPNIRQHWWLALQVPLFMIAEVCAILAHARRFRPTVIYSHWFMPQALAGGLAAWFLGIPHVFTTHSSDVEVLRRIPLLGPALVRRIVQSCRAYTAVSRRTADRLQDFFRPAAWHSIGSRLRIIPMGVNVTELSDRGPAQQASTRQMLGLGETPVLLFLGRLTEKKGLPDLLRAVAELRHARQPFQLVIAGDGELSEMIEKQVRELELGKQVRLPGFVTGEQKLAYLAAASVVVVPSIVTASGDVEGLPVSLMEGMAAGKLCVASDESGADAVITDGTDGFITPAGDPAMLAATLIRVLELDPSAASAIGERAALRAQEFDWARIAIAHYQHLFADLDPSVLAASATGD